MEMPYVVPLPVGTIYCFHCHETRELSDLVWIQNRNSNFISGTDKCGLHLISIIPTENGFEILTGNNNPVTIREVK